MPGELFTYPFTPDNSDIGNRTYKVYAEIIVGGYIYARNYIV